MSVQIERGPQSQTVTIANGQTKSSPFLMSGFAGGEIRLPATFTGTAITFETASEESGTYKPKKDGSGSAVSLTCAAGDALSIPAELYGSWLVKIVSGSAEAAERAMEILLVS